MKNIIEQLYHQLYFKHFFPEKKEDQRHTNESYEDNYLIRNKYNTDSAGGGI
jgi:hypothetical protein